jgi:hypothetical protein
MARCSTLYQCFNFLARNGGTIGLAPHPDDPNRNRLTITITGLDPECIRDETIAAVEYPCNEEMDFMDRVLGPICKTLAAHLEKEAENAKTTDS